MRWRLVLGAVLAVVLLAVSSRAAIAPISKDDLKKGATDIFVGQVTYVCSAYRTPMKGLTSNVYLIRIRLNGKPEKGNETAKDVVVTAWKVTKHPPDWAGDQGQDVIPLKGDLVRVYAVGSKFGGGAYEALRPNGIVPIQAK